MINFYIISTPIGNYEDITLRALKVLKEIDFIVCESEKEYKKLFGILNIKEKKYILCNEHNENEAIQLVIPLLRKGEKGALISDCGTPVFEDPGFNLLDSIRKNGFKITAIPGASSLMTALPLSPFRVNNFYYAGKISPKKYERKNELLNLLNRNEVIIIIETPYRLKNIISLLKETSSNRRIFIAYNMTLQDEELISGKADEIEKIMKDKHIKKGEFIIIIEGESGKGKKTIKIKNNKKFKKIL